MDRDPLLFEGFSREGGDLLVLDRQHAVEDFDDRHLGAHVVVKAGEFDADRARADDQQRFGDRRRHHRFLVGPNSLTIGLEPRQAARSRAGGQHDVLGGEFGDGIAVLRHGQPALSCQAPLAVENRNLVLAQQIRNAIR